MRQRLVKLPPKLNYAKSLGPGRALLQTKDNRLVIWDIWNEKIIRKIYCPSKDQHSDYTLLLNQEVLAVEYAGLQLSVPGNAMLYDLRTGEQLKDEIKQWIKQRKNVGETEHLISLVQSSQRQTLAATIAITTRRPGLGLISRYLVRCKLIHKHSGFTWETCQTDAQGIRRAVAFSPDSRVILTFNRRGEKTWLSLIETWTGDTRWCFRFPVDVHNLSRYTHAFSNNSNLLAVTSDDDKVVVFDTRSGKMIATLDGQQGQGPSINSSPKY